MIGESLNQYRIIEKLGAGGMGEVYRARDQRLQRDVALKLLLPAETAGGADAILREAHAVAALNHPHICTIYEVGEAGGRLFLVMELVEGSPLKSLIPAGGMSTELVLRYGAEIAAALAHAHERGVIHRDVKSSNIAIARESGVKVLDFGLAKQRSATELEEATRSEKSLADGSVIVGTLPYIAPEILRGETANVNTDIWSLGVVLYEMATGALPFRGQTAYQLSSVILRELPAPAPAHVPPGLRRVIERCLAKDPGQRYQRAGEIQAALEAVQPENLTRGRAPAPPTARTPVSRRKIGWTAGSLTAVLFALLVALNVGGLRQRIFAPKAPGRVRSLAVLPLENLSHDPEQDYFADGMTDELITDLAQISALRVISRTSVMQYKQTKKSMPEIAKELNVDGVVEGSVEREGDRVRIRAQLIEAATDRHLWAKSYERDLRDILAMQDEVASAIAGEIKITLTPQEQDRLSRVRTVDPEAYELYLKGRAAWSRRTEADIETGMKLFQKAIEKDPKFALGYVGLADSYLALQGWYAISPQDAYPKAREAAERALAIDDTLAEANVSLATIAFEYDWNFPKAETLFRRAIELNPSYATAHQWYAESLTQLNRTADAVAEARRAQELDPLSPIVHCAVGNAYYFSRQYEPAETTFREVVLRNPDFAAGHFFLGRVLEQTAEFTEAISEIQKAVELSGGNEAILAGLAHAYAAEGDAKRARQTLKQIETISKRTYVSPAVLAFVHAELKEEDQAMALLGESYTQHDSFLLFLGCDPRFDSLRDDPRFKELIHRVGLPQSRN
jgi:eukaryotic-like serine/threonine-protein kinase